MGILNAFFDVVAGVSILAGRSSLLDTRLTTVAGRNLTLRTTLGLGFFGVGFVNIWAASRRQKKIDKLAKGSESFTAETNFDCIVCNWDLEDIVKGHEEGSWITCQGDYAGDENACGRFFCSNHSNREDFKCPKCGGYEDRLTGRYQDFEAESRDGVYHRKSPQDGGTRWEIFWEGDSRFKEYYLTLENNPNDIGLIVQYDPKDYEPYTLIVPQPDTKLSFDSMKEVLEYLNNNRTDLYPFTHLGKYHRTRYRVHSPYKRAESFEAEDDKFVSKGGVDLLWWGEYPHKTNPTEGEKIEREIHDLFEGVKETHIKHGGKDDFQLFCDERGYDCWDEWDWLSAKGRYFNARGFGKEDYIRWMTPEQKTRYDDLRRNWFTVMGAETFDAESCVSCETPDWYYVGGLCSENGEMKCISCCSCDDCHNRWSQLEVGEMQGAESFGAEQIGKRGNRKQMMRVGDLKKALRKAKDTDIVLAGDIYDERVYDTQGIVKHKNYVAILGNKGNHYDEWVQSDEWDYGDNETWSFAESFNAEKLFGVVDNSGDGNAFIGDYKNRKEIMKEYFVWLISHLEELDHDEALKSINYPPPAIQRVYEKMDADEDEENWDENMALMDKRFDSWYNQLSAKKIRTFIDKWGDSVLWYGPEGHSQGLYTVDDTLEEGLGVNIEGSFNPTLDVSAETFSAPAAVMRTYKGRKSPALSAKSVKVGTRKRGNDGRMWQVRRAGNTQRWFRD